MTVDKSRIDVQSGSIHHLALRRNFKLLANRCNLAVVDQDIRRDRSLISHRMKLTVLNQTHDLSHDLSINDDDFRLGGYFKTAALDDQNIRILADFQGSNAVFNSDMLRGIDRNRF